MLDVSWTTFEHYTSPLGIGFVVEGGYGGGDCAPVELTPECDNAPYLSDNLGDYAGWGHYELDPCHNFYYSNWTKWGLGCDRNSIGSEYR